MVDTNTNEAKAPVHDAYWEGRNSWYPGEATPENPYKKGTPLAANWQRGLRDVMAEERLNLCTEWDDK